MRSMWLRRLPLVGGVLVTVLLAAALVALNRQGGHPQPAPRVGSQVAGVPSS